MLMFAPQDSGKRVVKKSNKPVKQGVQSAKGGSTKNAVANIYAT